MPFALKTPVRKAGEAMKFESLLSTLGTFGGTSLWVRLMTQSVELAVAAIVIEWWARHIRTIHQRLRRAR